MLIRLDFRGGSFRWLLSLGFDEDDVLLEPSDSLCVGVVAETGEASLEDGLDKDGGWGNDPMLMVFLSVFAGCEFVGRLEVDICCFFDPGKEDRVGSAEDAERELLVNGAGKREAPDPGRDCVGVAGGLVDESLVLDTGKDGNGVLGGPNDGREGRGRVVTMMLCNTSRDRQHGCYPSVVAIVVMAPAVPRLSQIVDPIERM